MRRSLLLAIFALLSMENALCQTDSALVRMREFSEKH